MRRLAAALICCFGCSLIWMNNAKSQGRGGADWMTSNGDAQRSSWVRTDAKISKENMRKPGFQFLWKMKLKNQPRQLNSLTAPATLERLIGYRGFRMLGFVGGSSDSIFVIDTDLGRMEWEKRLTSTAPPHAGTLACPGGMTAGVARPTLAALPSLAGAGGGFGRSTPAKGEVGAPGKGAVTLAMVRPAPPSPAPGQPPANPARPNPANPPGGQFGRGAPNLVYALSGDGMLHMMHVSNGADYKPPLKFLPPNANAHGLIVIDNVAYVVTDGGCGEAPNGVWALDIASGQVTTWKADIAGLVGSAFGVDGTLYVTTRGGGELPNSLVALDPKILKVKGWYTAGNQEFSSSPVVFEHKGKILIAATTKDGRVHLLDSANLGGESRTALYTTPALSKAEATAPGALASWQDRSGARWILAATAGSQAADLGFAATNGRVTNGAVIAWKLVEQNGALTLQPAWASRDLVSPLPPTIINGVVFVTSGGEFHTNDSRMTVAERARRSSRAVLYALDGETGKELWSSGTAITSFTRGAALSGGVGQIYLTTYDGVIYAFGFPMEH
jgi:outer membrane protein assembly factor BamB